MSSLARAFRRVFDGVTGAGERRDQERERNAALARQRQDEQVAQDRQLSAQQQADERTGRARRRRRGRRLFLSEESGGVARGLGGI